MFGTRTLLGLAIDEFGISVAEVRIRPGRPQVQRLGQLSFEEKLNSDNAKDIGQKLRQFLRINHFSSKQAIVGFPTKWVVAKEIVVPPASPDALSGMLNIQAERAFSLNTNDLAFDYCGRTSASEQSKVLLLAARREIVEQIRELTHAAGLDVRSITVSALAFGKTLSQTSPEHQFGLYARPTYCELWTQVNGNPVSIQHVPLVTKNRTTDEHVELLTSTIQRLILWSSQRDYSPPYRLTIFDGYGLSDELIERLNKQLRPQIAVANGSAGLLSAGVSSPDSPEESQSIAAVAIAVTAVDADKPSIDFLNPRMGLKKTSSRKSITIWASIIGAVCLMALVAVFADWQSDRRYIATYTQELELMSEDITAAREVVDNILYATSWTSQEPVFLNCLRELALAFPEEPVIWATNLRLSENAGALVGKAVDEESFYGVLDKIKQHEAFNNVQMIHIRNAGRDSREKEFAVNFEFRGVK